MSDQLQSCPALYSELIEMVSQLVFLPLYGTIQHSENNQRTKKYLQGLQEQAKEKETSLNSAEARKGTMINKIFRCIN